jgi:branched-chain amino acid transport system substrate-binding protein
VVSRTAGRIRPAKRHVLGTLLAVVVTATACSNAPLGSAGPSASGASAPGVSGSQIDVGALATLSGPLSSDFAPIVPGVEAYLDMVDAHGGVDGRKIVLSAALDDGGDPTQDADLTRTLVEHDHVFAVVGVATPFFQGQPLLVATGTPTFGYATEDDWSPAPNLFAAYGSVLSYASSSAQFAYLAERLHASSVAVLAYGVPQSADECQAAQAAFGRYGIHVGFSDLSVPFGSDLSSDVVRMHQAGVDFVVSCMDVTGNLSLSTTVQQSGMVGVRQVWLDGYDQSVLQQDAPLMQNTYFLLQHVPFEGPATFPGAYPGMAAYLAAMARYEPQYASSEVALEGWLSAALFVAGLRAIGRDVTQQRLIRAINGLTDFTGGVSTPVDWRVAHTTVTSPACEAYVVVQGTSFKMAFNNGSDPWVCFPLTHATIAKPVPPPAGSPGS